MSDLDPGASSRPEPREGRDPFTMLYCDNIRCRVNTFECGGSIGGAVCPACHHIGEEMDR